jgi:hypothetical protein
VEEKGYKSIMNLPDWVNIHNIFIKSEKQFENGRIYLPDTCPVSDEQWTERTRSGVQTTRSMPAAIMHRAMAGNNGGKSRGSKPGLGRRNKKHEKKQKRMRNGSPRGVRIERSVQYDPAR